MNEMSALLHGTAAINDRPTIINQLLDEVIFLCADCDGPLATRLTTILHRSPPMAALRTNNQIKNSAATALSMLIYLSNELDQGSQNRVAQIEACIHELVVWSSLQQAPSASRSARSVSLH